MKGKQPLNKLLELYQRYKSMILYVFFGGVTTLINLLVYNVMYYGMDISNLLSTIVAWVLAVLTAFFTNKQIVFGSDSWKWEVLVREGFRFFECRVGTGIFELVFMYLTVDLLGWSGFVMKLIANVIVVILNYVASKKVIFTKK